MYSESDYYYEKSFNMSQTTINIIIIVILLVIFFFLFNHCSKNYFTNLNNNSDNKIDNQIDDLKNELAFVKEELLNKNNYNKQTKDEEEKPTSETQKIYNTDLLLNGNININNSNPNLNSNPNPNFNSNPNPNNPNFNSNPNINNQNDILIQPVAPPIIYDPILNYDRLKLSDPLVDPRGRSSADQIPTPQVAAQLNFPTQGILDRYHRVGLLIAIDHNHNHNNNHNRKNKSYEDFGNIEKIVKGNKVNVDSDVSSSNVSSSDNSSSKSNLSKYSDNSSDLQSISSSYNSKFKEKIIPNNVILDIADRDNDILELIGKKIANEWYRYFTSISKGNKIIKINVHNKNRKELYDGDVVYIPILKRHYKVKIDKLDMIEYNPYFL